MSLITGIDISNNNGNVDINGAYNSGAEYIYLKATEGRTFKDSYMDGFYNQCKAVGAKSGAYHFLVSTSDPEDQAKNFAEKIQGYEFELMPCLDVETNFDNLNDYVQRFVAAFSMYSNKELLLYTYTGFLSSLNNTSLSMFRKAWMANYNNREDLDSVANDALASAGIEIVGHQYTENGTLGVFSGDLNVFTDGVISLEFQTSKGTWKLDSKGWWFEYEDGTYPKNSWAKLPIKNNDADNVAWFLFNENGYMLYSWQQKDGNWYYLGGSNDGAMKTGWVFDSNYKRWFYFDDSGAMQTGWQKINDKWYYLQVDNFTDSTTNTSYVKGEMRTGWINLDGKDYLLYSTGEMAHDTVIYDYIIDSSGVATKNTLEK
ncbi:glucan-binding YG repeat protein [Clostridium saccharoperbutylacetonicum]|uniref:Lysozyme n=2 Tax=Clostridium TaxID=1485 RepID=M1MP50_9CLOT|nr:GH25 family lysozyme [Clostridium saccharoperbutylacetonicum]AGF59629.1 glycoside hydrolase family 25 [Clostridium saccharoperbutylacetonicum N1-4(HMT)]NRT64514.1 glucan-binding YG repeat protein [Clostridium saccharoperbutylacetonicum]NSB28989.1 glucan-binding YG repeat protein [Clostridium saccharoperbutylacetonicum]NSB46203.1 glucan-binding YG repeat protein [Clostridium saccharoperbutylacetonicum]